ncbi:MAG: hypothetical protein EOP85_14005, partial [Verrucomicrobiaceae bacterium]
MNLYLSSFRTGDKTDALREMAGGGPAMVIPNALDFSTDISRRQASIERETEDLAALGIAASPLDLRDYFGKEAELAAVLDGT